MTQAKGHSAVYILTREEVGEGRRFVWRDGREGEVNCLYVLTPVG